MLPLLSICVSNADNIVRCVASCKSLCFCKSVKEAICFYILKLWLKAYYEYSIHALMQWGVYPQLPREGWSVVGLSPTYTNKDFKKNKKIKNFQKKKIKILKIFINKSLIYLDLSKILSTFVNELGIYKY